LDHGVINYNCVFRFSPDVCLFAFSRILYADTVFCTAMKFRMNPLSATFEDHFIDDWSMWAYTLCND